MKTSPMSILSIELGKKTLHAAEAEALQKVLGI